MFGATGATAQDDTPVVQVALFYSPTCPHCHEIINNFLPTILPRYEGEIEMIYVDVTTEGGSMAMNDACDALNVPDARCGGVPAMVINGEYLVGSGEIPARMEILVKNNLATGGSDLSMLPMVWEAIQAQTANEETAGETESTVTTEEAVAPASIAARFASDIIGNSTAVVVLLALVTSLGVMVMALGSDSQLFEGNTPARLSIIMMVVGIAVIGGIIAGGGGFPSILAIVVAALLVIAIIMIIGSTSLNRDVPPILIAGLLVAAYLSYVETGSAEAVCGVVGDCNAVQASPYANLLGIPIGILGLIGYVLMLVAWGMGTFGKGRIVDIGWVALFWMALGGVTFSAYLTFLEPFVIGAVCAWCLTSAITMMAVLWMSAAAGTAALSNLNGGDTPKPQHPTTSHT